MITLTVDWRAQTPDLLSVVAAAAGGAAGVVSSACENISCWAKSSARNSSPSWSLINNPLPMVLLSRSVCRPREWRTVSSRWLQAKWQGRWEQDLTYPGARVASQCPLSWSARTDQPPPARVTMSMPAPPSGSLPHWPGRLTMAPASCTDVPEARAPLLLPPLRLLIT